MRQKSLELQRRVCATVVAHLVRENGEDSFEYLLVAGIVVVAAMVALIVGFEALVPKVVDHICPSVDTGISPVSAVGQCISTF